MDFLPICLLKCKEVVTNNNVEPHAMLNVEATRHKGLLTTNLHRLLTMNEHH